MNSLIVKMLPEQVSAFWDVIKYAIEESVPPMVHDHPDKINRILSSILRGTMDVWASYNKLQDETVKFESIAIVQVLYDEPSNTKNLLIYCLFGYDHISGDSWIQKFSTAIKVAKELGCTQVTAYSNSEKVIESAKKFGGDTSYTFISFDVDETVKKLNDLSEV